MNSRERKQASKLKKSRPEIKFEEDSDKNRTDPVKCPLCSRTLRCPRNVDYDEFMEAKNLRCLNSSDPICSATSKAKSNQSYVTRILKKVNIK